MPASCGFLSSLVFPISISDLAIPMKVPILCVYTRPMSGLYVSLLPDGQPLTLGEEVEEYLCLPVSSDTTPSGDE